MMTMTDERALELVLRQSFGQPKQYGPNAPATIPRLLSIHSARARGYATINEVFAPGMTAMAAPVQRPGHPALGAISIAGPLPRLDERA
ncbi:MAG: IclR family transcriptional regulator, acetate operon repressor [Caballeronia sp.]|jgi:DNA-binding IclR family transcriptional regulator|nr:IclR family transcriptional regulator, acetate operon repressor [Caballeronia sp.]